MDTRSWIGIATLSILVVAGCSERAALVEPERSELGPAASERGAGAVYLMNNSAAGNEIIAFDRAADGTLTSRPNVSTGGLGTDEPTLGNQGAIAMSVDRRWLFVVNPGSDDVSVLWVAPSGLAVTDVEGSGGDRPISVDEHKGLVYVLNSGMPNNVTGFRLDNSGDLDPIPGSARPLSAPMTGPAQVGFSPDGRVLIVTEKATNLITTYTVEKDGTLGPPQPQPAAGVTPFGFEFDHHGTLVVSEAFGGAADASTVSSYGVARDGTIHPIDPTVPTTETAACWIAISTDGRYAYTTNGGSASVTGFRIDGSGDLTILDADGVTAPTGDNPLDAAFSSGGRYLYVLSRASQQVDVFSLAADGSLDHVQAASGLPLSANGMAAF